MITALTIDEILQFLAKTPEQAVFDWKQDFVRPSDDEARFAKFQRAVVCRSRPTSQKHAPFSSHLARHTLGTEMSASTLVLLNQAGLVIGFIGSVLLAFSARVGVLSKDGSVIFTGLDPMESPISNVKRVRSSHWRNRFFTPIGWGMLALSFLLQFTATVPHG